MVLAGCETGTEMETETEGLAITETIIIWTLLILCQPFAPGGQKRGASSSELQRSPELELQFRATPLSQLNLELLLANFAAARNISRD